VADKTKYYANGKLLLTGEYLVLDGALAIALPTKLGQSLIVKTNEEGKLIWESQDSKSYPWFQHSYTHLHFYYKLKSKIQNLSTVWWVK